MLKNIIILLTVFMILLISCMSSNDTKLLDLSATEFIGKINSLDDDSTIILDVRTPGEFQEAHIINAINLDFYRSDFKKELDKFPKNKIFFVYCRSGNRSGQTLSLMKELGFKQTYNLKGGITTDTHLLPLI